MKGSKETSRREHREMLKAIESSNGVKARDIMNRHISSTLNKLEKMKKQEIPN